MRLCLRCLEGRHPVLMRPAKVAMLAQEPLRLARAAAGGIEFALRTVGGETLPLRLGHGQERRRPRE